MMPRVKCLDNTRQRKPKGPCPHCKGVGYFVHDGTEAHIDLLTGYLWPSEYREVCNACSGSGEAGHELDSHPP